jgi:hypothetical protein
MPRSLFSALRSADGRSLARALAALVVLSTVLGGIPAGHAALDFDHCIETPYGMLPDGHQDLTCCPGMMGGTPFLPPPAVPAIELPRAADIAIAPIPRDAWIPESPVSLSDRPRGPPLSA